MANTPRPTMAAPLLPFDRPSGRLRRYWSAQVAGVTRPLGFSRSLVAATERVAGWMRDAALEVRTDPIDTCLAQAACGE